MNIFDKFFSSILVNVPGAANTNSFSTLYELITSFSAQLLSSIRSVHFSPEKNVFDLSPVLKYTHMYDEPPVGGPEMPSYQQAEISACSVSRCPFGKLLQEQ